MSSSYPASRALRWIWLSNFLEPGTVQSDLLFEHFDGEIDRIYEAREKEYALIPGLSRNLIDRLTDKSMDGAIEVAEYCAGKNVDLLCPDMPAYPRRLLNIRRRPAVLYVKGTLPEIDSSVCIAVVGTREMTEYGANAAYSISYDMAKAGAVVVSGMARGIDGMAHRGALDAGGITVAVLGSGGDRPYPREHAALLEEIASHGAVLSEFRPFEPPVSFHFPTRNRIISGLSVGTLIVEAPRSSGALITAKDALYQGRDLFAVPGKLGERNSLGTNDLIKSGASIVTSAADVLERYLPLYPGKLDPGALSAARTTVPKKRLAVPKNGEPPARAGLILPSDPVLPEDGEAENVHAAGRETSSLPRDGRETEREAAPASPKSANNVPEGLTDREKEICLLIPEGQSAASDEIVRKAGLPVNEVMTTLTFLEMKGAIRALPGGLFVRC